ncbi:MAG: 50S ribosomal protein L10 [Candidatus Omnitrophica bacterium]|nr:50S ribosomal protein L10 [Candidatus Omnitrophota bacterium]
MKRVGQVYREQINSKIVEGIEQNEGVFVMSFSGLNGAKLSGLRQQLQKAGASMFVSKNSIAAYALKELKHDTLADRVASQTAFVWTNADSAAVSKVLMEFSKDLDNVDIRGGVLDGRTLAQADVQRLSDLPPREVLLSTLLGTIQAPLTRLAGALNAKSRDLLSILKQYSEKKGGN